MRILLAIILIITANISYAKEAKIAAVVGDQIITEQDIYNRYKLLSITAEKNKKPAPLSKHDRTRLLQLLIDEKLFVTEAKRLRLTVSDEDIQNAIRSIEEVNGWEPGKFEKFITESKLDRTSFIDQIRSSLIYYNLVKYIIRPKINITNKEIQETLIAVSPESAIIDFKQIYIPFSTLQNAKAVDAKMAELNNYRSLVKTCNDIKLVGAKLNPPVKEDEVKISLNKMHEDLRNMLKVLPEGTASKVIRTSHGLHLISICSKTHADLTKEDRAEINEILLEKKTNLQVTHYLNNLRKKIFIEIKD